MARQVSSAGPSTCVSLGLLQDKLTNTEVEEKNNNGQREETHRKRQGLEEPHLVRPKDGSSIGEGKLVHGKGVAEGDGAAPGLGHRVQGRGHVRLLHG